MVVGRGRNVTELIPIQIAAVPGPGVEQKEAIADVQRIMRIRHGLRLDEPDDFDIMTQDAILQLWDSISQATFLALIDLVDRPDGRRDRRDGHHVDLGDRADARDRRPEGAARGGPRSCFSS